MLTPQKYKFSLHGDIRGKLIAIEQQKDIPFAIKRVYYMYDTTNGFVRGCHAHKHLEQILICVHGSCRVRMDNGREQVVVPLDTPEEGLYLSSCIWREMFDFSPDAVLLVLASELYDEADYIRDYDAFLKYIKKEGQDE